MHGQTGTFYITLHRWVLHDIHVKITLPATNLCTKYYDDRHGLVVEVLRQDKHYWYQFNIPFGLINDELIQAK